ncbi:MAG: homocysteine S-methyltransferase [Saezia sp.]
MNTTTPNPIAHILREHKVMILDGAMATELERHGLNLNDSLWSAKVLYEKPQAIYDVHYSYLKAGADCIGTCSYQASLEGFLQKGFTQEEAYNLIKKSAQLALQAREDFIKNEPSFKNPLANRPQPLVAACIGPYGAYLADGSEYRGDYQVTPQALREFHLPRIQTMLDAGVDLLAFETLPCLSEVEVLLDLLQQFPQAYAWFSLSIKDPQHLCDGTPLADCAKLLNTSEQVAAIGVNCTALHNISPVIQTLKAVTSKPILAYPNSGETYDATTKTWHGNCDCNHNLATLAVQWVEQGIQLIGGCCRTTPQDIAALSHNLRQS